MESKAFSRLKQQSVGVSSSLTYFRICAVNATLVSSSTTVRKGLFQEQVSQTIQHLVIRDVRVIPPLLLQINGSQPLPLNTVSDM